MLRKRLDRTPPETSGPTTQVGTLGGLDVHAQAITTIEDEIRVTIPDAHVEARFLTNDLHRGDPSSLITRLERNLHRLPDTIAELNKEATTARAEAEQATARVGVPWDRADELARLRRRQQEIDEQLTATTEPSQDHQEELVPAVGPAGSSPQPGAPPPGVSPGRSAADIAAADRMTGRLDAIQCRSGLDPPDVGL